MSGQIFQSCCIHACIAGFGAVVFWYTLQVRVEYITLVSVPRPSAGISIGASLKQDVTCNTCKIKSFLLLSADALLFLGVYLNSQHNGIACFMIHPIIWCLLHQKGADSNSVMSSLLGCPTEWKNHRHPWFVDSLAYCELASTSEQWRNQT